MDANNTKTLGYHIGQVKDGNRHFENAYQAVARMILNELASIEKVLVNGKSTYDFKIFRTSPKHVIGMYDEVNSFVSFVKDAAEGGSSREMAFVLVGEPGNGKTFFVDYLCTLYRDFMAQEENRRYSFNIRNLEKLGSYGKIKTIQSQTFEDPIILAMNLLQSKENNKEYLAELGGFTDAQIDKLYLNYRPLGACSDYILNDIREHCDGDPEKLLSFFEVVPVPLSESMGTMTGKYSAKDKITSSAVDLLEKNPSRGCCTLRT